MKYERVTNLETRIIMGHVSRTVDPGCGFCYRCGRTWRVCAAHDTELELGHGCSALCEECWEELDWETRIPYYKMMFDSWEMDHKSMNIPMDKTWSQICAAVNNEGTK